MRYVCLFDIDGTLLNTGGAGQAAMERALEAAFGLVDLNHDIPAAGRTDRAITSDLFAHHGIELHDESWNSFVTTYVENLRTALADLTGTVLPGIVELLDDLSSHDDVSMGLLTGNFEQGAWLKLSHYQLDHHFAYGGFGDDHHDRDDVARTAYAEACRHLGRDVGREQVWVIGDTPSDIRCARAIGANVIAVATGIYSAEELAAAEPDHLVADFSDPGMLLARLN
ncbi:MAG: HAD family hydrolase [Maioricimonas sp. JB045]